MSVNQNTGALVASESLISFGSVSVGSTAKATITFANHGLSSIAVSQISLSGQPFTVTSQPSLPITVSVGGTFVVNLQFDPTSAASSSGQLTVTSSSPDVNPAVVSLSGTGMESSSSATSLSGVTCSTASYTAAGSDACTVSLSGAAGSSGLTVNLSSSSSTVAVPASVSVPSGATSANFTATVSSFTSTQTVTLTASAGSVSKTFALQLNVGTGTTGTATLSVNSTTVTFGNEVLNSPATQSLTLTSSGTAAVTVNSAAVTGTGFSVSGVTFPVTLNAGQKATLNVQFDPTAAGAATGVLTIVSTSASNPTTTVALSGTGVTVAVDLSWSAPAAGSDPAVGYNVYRTASGSSAYQKLNSSVDAQTKYTDSNVQGGATYIYYVTSVDASGNESTPSNVTTIAIP